MDGGATRVSVLTPSYLSDVRLLYVVVKVGLRLFDLFSLLVVVEVMFARNIGGDGSVTMVVMDHI
uniref:Transmembrane protein n=1 Tax=Medicago truncatula TaxID=3880 RepID=A2Q1E2_MEDTR|nr:hypothetical protein MtrDRAFT_AC148775g17v2 [Medicago truncatula]